MLSHIHIGISDFDTAFEFYGRIFIALDLKLKFAEPENRWAGWTAADAPRPLILIGAPFDGKPHAPGNGQMTAFLAATRAMVDRVHRIALENGGRCDGAPGLRPHYHADYYGAYFRDPDGNKLCVCCHEAE